jgi:bifunctional non-homologous end joining protein LigD
MDFTYRFPTIAKAVCALACDATLIDGEAVMLRNDGRSDFQALLTKRGWLMAAFVAFDLLRLNGDDLRARPLEKRREALMRLVAKRRGDGIVFSEALADEGTVVFAKACELASKASCRSGRAASIEAGEAKLAEGRKSGFRKT